MTYDTMKFDRVSTDSFSSAELKGPNLVQLSVQNQTLLPSPIRHATPDRRSSLLCKIALHAGEVAVAAVHSNKDFPFKYFCFIA